MMDRWHSLLLFVAAALICVNASASDTPESLLAAEYAAAGVTATSTPDAFEAAVSATSADVFPSLPADSIVPDRLPEEPSGPIAQEFDTTPSTTAGTAGEEPMATTVDLVAADAQTSSVDVAQSDSVGIAQIGSIPYNQQCGGRSTPGCGASGRACADAAWTGATCVAGHFCRRDNEWWWSCQPGGSPSPALIPYNQQCGGRSTPGCGAPGRACADAAWTGATCVAGHFCRRDNEWWWSCQPGSGGGGGGVTPPPSGNGGCPTGWLPAVGTLYDSWPKPGTTECIAYSGCRWAGMFARVSPGPCGGPCAVARDGSRAQRLNGGDGQTCCRWPEAVVSRWSMAATWDRDPALLNRRLEVRVAGRTNTVTVNVRDVCNDADCGGCCSANTGRGAYKLIDLEKWPASALLGFSHTSPSFDINNVRKPTAASTGIRRPGAPESSVMPLCYRDLGALAPLV